MSTTITVTELATQYARPGTLRLKSGPEIPVALPKLPEELLSEVVERILVAGIQMIEWDALLFQRMNVPVLIKNYSYIVPADKLDEASIIASDFGLPLSTPSKSLVLNDSDFYSQSRLHNLTDYDDDDIGRVKYLSLFPDSYISFLPSELSPAPGIKSLNYLVPQPSATYAAIIRLLATRPRQGGTRSLLLAKLGMLITYNLYPDHESDSEDDDDVDIEHALRVIRQWDPEWRQGEEWIGDALEAVARTGATTYLPWGDVR